MQSIISLLIYLDTIFQASATLTYCKVCSTATPWSSELLSYTATERKVTSTTTLSPPITCSGPCCFFPQHECSSFPLGSLQKWAGLQISIQRGKFLTGAAGAALSPHTAGWLEAQTCPGEQHGVLGICMSAARRKISKQEKKNTA